MNCQHINCKICDYIGWGGGSDLGRLTVERLQGLGGIVFLQQGGQLTGIQGEGGETKQ